VGMELKLEVGKKWEVAMNVVGEFTVEVGEKWDVVVKMVEQFRAEVVLRLADRPQLADPN